MESSSKWRWSSILESLSVYMVGRAFLSIFLSLSLHFLTVSFLFCFRDIVSWTLTARKAAPQAVVRRHSTSSQPTRYGDPTTEHYNTAVPPPGLAIFEARKQVIWLLYEPYMIGTGLLERKRIHNNQPLIWSWICRSVWGGR